MLHLSQDLRDEILNAASAAFPVECCGLIEGVFTTDTWQALAVHRTKNLAEDPANHFLVDPQAHFELLRSLRGSERRIIGCYHSHPNGLSVPSANDRAKAIEPNFVWLIAAGEHAQAFALSAYVFDERAGDFISLDLYP
jgi:proteasome lid subunit RPN8/RPN11